MSDPCPTHNTLTHRIRQQKKGCLHAFRLMHTQQTTHYD